MAETVSARGYVAAKPATPAVDAARDCEIVALDKVPLRAWSQLFARSIEPNTFYAPEWARAVHAHARGHGNARVLLAWDGPARQKLIGLLPVVSAWRALKLPLPILVAWQGYAPLATPLLDRDCAAFAAGKLIEAAKAAGAYALLLPFLPEQGAAAAAFRTALAGKKRVSRITHREARAMLDARSEPDTLLRDALGAKKLKELRRQRNRLSDDGAVNFFVAEGPQAVSKALEQFLTLEATGWKGRRGTALGEDASDKQFIRDAGVALAASGQFEVAVLSQGERPVAAGLMLRDSARANFFKIAYDETLGKTSPGVQLTLDITRHYCADEAIAEIDSTANANHPMIDHVWRGRFALAETLIPVQGTAALARLFQLVIVARRKVRNVLRYFYRKYRSFREK